MNNFTLYHNRNHNTKKIYPYVLNIQTSLLSDLSTRLVIPLSLMENFENRIIKNLNPIIKIKAKEYLVLTQQMASIPLSAIGDELLDVKIDRNEILAAIDFIVTGI